MALKVNYDLNGDFYPDAYVKVQKVTGATAMVEEWVEDGKGNLILKYRKEPEHLAQIFVFPDEEARFNNARPLHHFGIEFEYDPQTGGNIYKAAYEALKNVKKISQEHYIDV